MLFTYRHPLNIKKCLEFIQTIYWEIFFKARVFYKRYRNHYVMISSQ
jgi:hypothetical protein